jgi:DNA helicase-2/ATP-dependent DNA helicase PcrA
MIKLEKPTAEQVAIYDAMETAGFHRSNTPSFAVDAKAGSGKTTTIVACVDAFPKNSALVAFNKNAADQLAEKIAGACPASTFHSLGFRIMRERFEGAKVSPYKVSNLVQNKFKWGRMYRPYADVLEGIMTHGFGIYNPAELQQDEIYLQAMGLRDVPLPTGLTLESFIARCKMLMMASLETPAEASFAEMLYMPLFFAARNKWDLQDYSHLIVDEAQDVSWIRMELIKKVAKHCIAVGDPDQAIYGFAGAMSDAFGNLIERYNMPVLPLSTSWRCSKAVIEEARQVIGPRIFAREDAIEGSIKELDYQILSATHSVSNSDALLCRTNAPLFKLAMEWVKQQKPFRLWSDFAERLLALAKRIAKDARGTAAYKSALFAWKEEQQEIYKESKGTVRRIAEQYECLMVVMNMSEDVSDMLFNLELLLNSEVGPVLCTIHKAKGLEWENVYLVRPDLIPAPWVNEFDEEEMQQEDNLKYVAITRAKDSFTYVIGGDK